MSTAQNGSVASASSTLIMAEKERRSSIQAIMRDKSLNEMERRRSIQSLMDGRRRGSLGVFQRCNIATSSEINMRDQAAGSLGANGLEIQEDDLSDLDDDSTFPDQKPSLKRSFQNQLDGGSTTSHNSKNSIARNLGLSQTQLDHMTEELGNNIAFNVSGHQSGCPRKLEEGRPKCDHYDRNCSIISPCCGMVFGCRLCHDDCDYLSPPLFKEELNEEEARFHNVPRKIKLENSRRKFARRGSMSSIMSSISEMGDDIHHSIDRFAVQEIICRKCYTRQSSKSNKCITCKTIFGDYHCNICNLWMSAKEQPYHCADCGFCRVGGSHRFKHCQRCGMCIDIELFDNHNCKSGKFMANCPVCYEDLFSSRSATHEMPCGHNIHWHCYNSLARHDIRCPICKKTATDEDMSEVWRGLALDVAMQPIPPDLTRVVDISCNDCGEKDQNRRWHFLGVQCKFCMSFNTTHNAKMFGVEADNFLNSLEFTEFSFPSLPSMSINGIPSYSHSRDHHSDP